VAVASSAAKSSTGVLALAMPVYNRAMVLVMLPVKMALNAQRKLKRVAT
tara:strand:- start:3921 stop:4067 length:147 start_codon:yes stop_codon:yes gene_type:complete